MPVIGLVALVLVALAAALWALSWPWGVQRLRSQPHPARDYAEALQRIEALRARESPQLNPLGRLLFLTHGGKAQRVVVLMHGYSNCPQQFRELAQRLHALGYNALALTLPHHGLADRLTPEQARLKASEMAACADEALDIAQGLGEQVTVMGFSAGGVMAAWAAHQRRDLEQAVIISPAFGYRVIPTPLTAAAMNVISLLPDAFSWWDPALQAAAGPAHTYPRYSRHALMQILRLGFAVQVAARRERPLANSLCVVTNANDQSVNNALTGQIVAAWRQRGAQVSTYEFPAELRLDHDLIDPGQPAQRIEIVYPRLIELATGEH
jgi:alpha-beta hydrolase superfamily lysophospholipase